MDESPSDRAAASPEESVPTVMFVDDERDLLDVYSAVFGRDFDVVTAECGSAALDVFGEHVDFVFLDRRMPGMTGCAVLEQLREDGYRTPVAMLSAVDRDVETPSDIVAYISKPADMDALLAVVHEHATAGVGADAD